MLLEDLQSVLTFNAFKPDADDYEISWAKRHLGRRTLLLNVSRNHVTWRAINKKGRFTDSGMQEGEFPEVVSARAEEWRSLCDGGWCSVSVNSRFIMSLESNLSRRENTVELLRVNPKAILGAKFDRGKRYALYHHPEAVSSLLMACDDTLVKSVEDTMRVNLLKPGRISCGLFAMVQNKLNDLYENKRPEARGNFLFVACCEGSIAALVQQGGQWTDLRCRAGVGSDVEGNIQIITPLVQKLTEGTPTFFLHDGNDNGFGEGMMEQLSKIGAKNITEEDQLWKIIGQD